MNTFITYLFEANCTLLLCGFFYYVFMKNETDFRGRRFYLIGATLLSLVIPVLNLNFLLPDDPAPALRDMQALILPEIIIGDGSIAEAESTSMGYSLYITIYIAGAALLFAWFLFQIGQVFWFFSQHSDRSRENAGYTLLRTRGTLPTFSFFRILFLDDSVALSAEEEQRIIAHEEAHIKELHSLDIVLLEISKILFWFNPVSWFFRREVQDIHEYLADDASVKYTSADEYTSLLAKMALNKAHLPIGHHFNKSKTLKRIKMMNTTKTKIKKWKWLSTLSLTLIILIAFSCNDEAMNDIQHVMDQSAVSTEIPPEIQAKIAELKEKDPEGEFVYLETSMENEDEVARLKDIDPSTIAMVNVDKENQMLGMIVKQNGTMNTIVDKYSGDSEVFVVVEEPALPVGGMESFYSYIATNLKYPTQAKNAGIEGKVYVQMVIDTDGSVTDVTVVKGIGYGCDEEAKRVIAGSPAWNPGVQRGKKVKQRVIVPLSFTLGNGSAATDGEIIELMPGSQMKVSTQQSGNAISGKVADQQGNPLAGVNVVIEGTNMGTVSDVDGTFKIKLTDTGKTLRFSYVGFESVRKSFD